MTAEQVIASQLARRLGSLVPGHRHPIVLDQIVSGRPGPHRVGWLERVSPGEVKIWLGSTGAARDARALMQEDMLDVWLEGYPPVVRLGDNPREM